jgi:L-ascorbate metabolism protein UlaG (beta-lactamase superfamily)
VKGFTMFHAGDSWNIIEYEQLSGEIDLVFLPLGPGCQTMTEMDVVRVVETIEPNYFIPIHFSADAKETFIDQYKDDVEDCGCTFIDLDYYSSYVFN